ncbi:ribosomal-processing cysteine protease Prp [Domibacillus indicus]|uniref:ribosomal-processing cysteine protease Prp n=1 Tax=Domibacillus indicus TaxID=1437523 RepID=UPI000618261D|nr:ribosomal-processing cysteine protease Prp [Domibacillus indicus]
MIYVNINRNESGCISSFTMEGHAGFDDSGKDLVCAGASAVSFGALNAVMALTGIIPDIEQGKDGGLLSCRVPDGLPEAKQEQVQLLLEGMIVSLQTIEEEYGQYIQVKFL